MKILEINKSYLDATKIIGVTKDELDDVYYLIEGGNQIPVECNLEYAYHLWQNALEEK